MPSQLNASHPLLGVFFLVIGCGGSTGPAPAPAPAPPPPPPPPAPVATVEVTPPSSDRLIGGTVQLTATTKDGSGNTLNGRSVTWSSSDQAVATVSTSGLVTAAAVGNATITAASEGKNGVATVAVFDPGRIPTFIKPFAEPADLWTTNYHDHDVPKEFIDNNGVYVPFWGESSLLGIDGHEGYDWRLPIGTPLVAVAAGRVVFAGPETPFFCPILNATVAGQGVRIEHTLPTGIVVRSVYAHMDRIDVQVGAEVTQGQQIGTSGDKGCALNPHLHFAVRRVTQTGAPAIDPFGWSGPGADPWEGKAEGAKSIDLWKPNEAPSLFRRGELPLPAQAGAFFQLTKARFQGVRDNQNPNNEYVEVARDDRVAPAAVDLTGVTIRNRAGLVFTFPAGASLTAANPAIRVFTGSGTNTASTLFIGQAAGVYDNLTDCVRVFNAAAQSRGQIGWGTLGCN
jgi:murein DD-endopeptidase MepM/ murein hydrolase activator NlpD